VSARRLTPRRNVLVRYNFRLQPHPFFWCPHPASPPVCDELHSRATNKSASRAELQQVAQDRALHRQDIMSLRQFYLRDILRAERDYTFQTIAFDGTNSNTCKCPLSWRSYFRDEQAEGTFVQQKIQSVLIHGVALIFYVVTPCVPLGMNLTVSSVIDALQYLKPTTRAVRFQFDGLFTCFYLLVIFGLIQSFLLYRRL
jgi:hypothetical protein